LLCFGLFFGKGGKVFKKSHKATLDFFSSGAILLIWKNFLNRNIFCQLPHQEIIIFFCQKNCKKIKKINPPPSPYFPFPHK
jgi:hypothetical protein